MRMRWQSGMVPLRLPSARLAELTAQPPPGYHCSCASVEPLRSSRVDGRAPISGAPIEATLELWASELRVAKARIRPLSTQERVAALAGPFLDGLLGPERRKTGWMHAEAASDPGPWRRRRAVLGRGYQEVDAPRGTVRDHALEALADVDAVPVIDETGFPEQDEPSCGVARQCTGSAGKVTNRRIGVFPAYVLRHGHIRSPERPLSRAARPRPGPGAALDAALPGCRVSKRRSGARRGWVGAAAVLGMAAPVKPARPRVGGRRPMPWRGGGRAAKRRNQMEFKTMVGKLSPDVIGRDGYIIARDARRDAASNAASNGGSGGTGD